MPWEPDALASALRSGDLYGDRIASYLVRCLLPGAVAVGGPVQQDYVEAYRQMIIETHRVIPFLSSAEQAAVRHSRASRLGGAPLLELDAGAERAMRTLGPRTDLKAWSSAFMSRPVRDTIGTLRCTWYYDDLLDRAARRPERGAARTRPEVRA